MVFERCNVLGFYIPDGFFGCGEAGESSGHMHELFVATFSWEGSLVDEHLRCLATPKVETRNIASDFYERCRDR